MEVTPLLCIQHKLQGVPFGGKVINILYADKIMYFPVALTLFFFPVRTKICSCNGNSVCVHMRACVCVKNYFEIDAHAAKFQPKHFKYCKVISK